MGLVYHDGHGVHIPSRSESQTEYGKHSAVFCRREVAEFIQEKHHFLRLKHNADVFPVRWLLVPSNLGTIVKRSYRVRESA